MADTGNFNIEATNIHIQEPENRRIQGNIGNQSHRRIQGNIGNQSHRRIQGNIGNQSPDMLYFLSYIFQDVCG